MKHNFKKLLLQKQFVPLTMIKDLFCYDSLFSSELGLKILNYWFLFEWLLFSFSLFQILTEPLFICSSSHLYSFFLNSISVLSYCETLWVAFCPELCSTDKVNNVTDLLSLQHLNLHQLLPLATCRERQQNSLTNTPSSPFKLLRGIYQIPGEGTNSWGNCGNGSQMLLCAHQL